MPGKEGMIPNYILKTLEEEALEIKFNLDDLSTLYDERNIKIDEESTFYEIIKLCKKENAAVQCRFIQSEGVFHSDRQEILS